MKAFPVSNSECKTFSLKSLKSSKRHNICFALDFLSYFGILSKFNVFLFFFGLTVILNAEKLM